jgi:methylthioribose-1-phosphate isomerase
MVAVDWVGGSVRFIDQTRLPAEERFEQTADWRVVEEAIRALRIRGAPALGVAAAFALCLAAGDPRITSMNDLQLAFRTALEGLAASRPTAVNLFTALARMRRVAEHSFPSGVAAVRERLLREALAIRQEDVDACRTIGELGAQLLEARSTVLTHCNAGALATAGTGTALSVIVSAWTQGRIARVYVDETRPLFQGARLTTWELGRAGVPHTLITDSTAGSLFRRGAISAVIVGADRIAANGDTANKVGTYPLAVLALHHGVPFFIAAPTSTIDRETPTGDDIPIEERDPAEVTHAGGIRIAPEGVEVFAPAFDVTPQELIGAIVTEAGILRPPLASAIARLAFPADGERAEVR